MFGCSWLKGGLVWMSPSGRKTIPNGWDSTCGLDEPSILRQSAASQAFECIKACKSFECLRHLVKLLLGTGIGNWFYIIGVPLPPPPWQGRFTPIWFDAFSWQIFLTSTMSKPKQKCQVKIQKRGRNNSNFVTPFYKTTPAAQKQTTKPKQQHTTTKTIT